MSEPTTAATAEAFASLLNSCRPTAFNRKKRKKCFSNRHTNTLSVTEREIREFLVENKEKKGRNKRRLWILRIGLLCVFPFYSKTFFLHLLSVFVVLKSIKLSYYFLSLSLSFGTSKNRIKKISKIF